jgi:hypothetical protein
MAYEPDELPRAVCPKCGDVVYDLQDRRGGPIYCTCGAKMVVVQPLADEHRRTRLPD